jgi:hypothetical protein
VSTSLENKPLEEVIETVRSKGVHIEDCECAGCSAFSELVVRMRCVRIAIAARQPLARIEQALTGATEETSDG